MVVADTGPILAAANRRDELHELAAALVTAAGRQLAVPDPVVTEVDRLLRDRVGSVAARRFLDALVSGIHERLRLGPSLFARAVAIDRHYAALDLGLADASVMAVAQATNSPILTFDFSHFRAAPPTQGGAWRLVIEEVDYRRWRKGH